MDNETWIVVGYLVVKLLAVGFGALAVVLWKKNAIIREMLGDAEVVAADRANDADAERQRAARLQREHDAMRTRLIDAERRERELGVKLEAERAAWQAAGRTTAVTLQQQVMRLMAERDDYRAANLDACKQIDTLRGERDDLVDKVEKLQQRIDRIVNATADEPEPVTTSAPSLYWPYVEQPRG